MKKGKQGQKQEKKRFSAIFFNLKLAKRHLKQYITTFSLFLKT